MNDDEEIQREIDEEIQIEIEDKKLSIIQKDLEDKIQEYLSKRFEIDQKYIELSQIRKDIYNLKFEIDEMRGETKDTLDSFTNADTYPDKSFSDRRHRFNEKFYSDSDEVYESDKGIVFLKKYKSEFSSYLKKEFSKLDIKKKRELFKAGLLKVRFYLNYLKYAKIKNEGKKTELDDYVFEREGTFPYYLNIKFNDKTLKELENTREHQTKHSKLEDEIRVSEIKDLEEEIKEEKYGREEDWDFSIDYEPDDEEDN